MVCSSFHSPLRPSHIADTIKPSTTKTHQYQQMNQQSTSTPLIHEKFILHKTVLPNPILSPHVPRSLPMCTAPTRLIHQMQTQLKSDISKPRQLLNINHSLSNEVLTCASKAVKYPRWKLAMADEYNALLYNRTWELVPSHPYMKVVGSKWVFKIKEKLDGSIEHFKARLVAQCFKEQHILVYNETFSMVIKPQTICVVFPLVISSPWTIHQLDVKNVLLHGHLQELVYMNQTSCFIHPTYPQVK